MTTRIVESDQAVTPNRAVRLVLDVDEEVCTVPAWFDSRSGGEIACATAVGLGSSTNVSLHGAGEKGAWGLRPMQEDASALHEDPLSDRAVVRLSQWNLVPALFEEKPLQHAQADVPGITGGGVADVSDFFLIKQMPEPKPTVFELQNAAGGASDAQIFPKPPPCINARAPVDRVGVSKIGFRANAGFHLRFKVPGTGFSAKDVVWAFYFGGPVPYANAGRYCLVFFGNGQAQLWRGLNRDWFPAMVFNYASPAAVAGKDHAVTIKPQGRDTIVFAVASSDRALPQGRGSAQSPAFGGAPPSPHATEYRATSAVTGSPRGKTVTGPSQLRIDIRRDLLLELQISQLVYPDEGLLVDHAFLFASLLPGGTRVLLNLGAVIPDGCTLEPRVYRFDDIERKSPLPLQRYDDSNWFFASLPGVRQYYCAFKITSGDGSATPLLFRRSLRTQAEFRNRKGLNFAVEPSSLSVSGPDEDPSHESAHVVIQDLDNQDAAVLLRRGGEIHVRAEIAYVEEDRLQVVTVFEGRTGQIERTPMGYPEDAYPHPLSAQYSGDLQPMYERAHRQRVERRHPIAPFGTRIDGAGASPGILVTDVAYDVLRNVARIPDDMLDIPRLPVPYAPAEPQIDDFIIQPRTSPIDWAARLIRDQLGWFFFFDGNAYPRGRYRIRPLAGLFGPQSAPLWNFSFTGPGLGKDPIYHGSYPENTSFIIRDESGANYQDWAEAPEYNFIRVIANANDTELSAGGKMFKGSAWAHNADSYDLDPDHPTANPDRRVNPDFVGERIDLVVWDPTLAQVPPEEGGVQGACNAMARMLIEQYGHARKWFRFRAPLVFVKDPTDPLLLDRWTGQPGRRHLRHNDPITVGYLPAILKSCNPEEPLRPDWQMAWYQGVFSTFPIS